MRNSRWGFALPRRFNQQQQRQPQREQKKALMWRKDSGLRARALHHFLVEVARRALSLAVESHHSTGRNSMICQTVGRLAWPRNGFSVRTLALRVTRQFLWVVVMGLCAGTAGAVEQATAPETAR